MTLDHIAAEFEKNAERLPNLGKTLKVVLDIGTIFLDLTGEKPQLTYQDKEADCTITTKADTLEAMRNGQLNPMMAVMTGKVKIKGDMGVAMQLQKLFG